MGDAQTDAAKQVLFDKVRNGSVRILIGSTQKMGTGTNVQKRLVALHHLDAPWKPAEVEQRDGRILRQGNQNEEVAVYRYVTEGSFDAFMWQALETKARFISQVITGDNAARRAEDLGGQELSYAEVKAIASGNPAVLTLAEADAELQRLAILKKNHLDEQYAARRGVRELPKVIQNQSEYLIELAADKATAEGHAGSETAIDGRAVAVKDLSTVLGQKLDGLPRRVAQTTRVPIGTYRGLAFGLITRPEYPPDVYVEGKTTRQSILKWDHQGPRAVMNAVERLVGEYESEISRITHNRRIAQGQLRDYQTVSGNVFQQEAYQNELTALRDQLKDCLSDRGAAVATPGTAARTSLKIAEQIKLLRATNSVDAAPARPRKKVTAAEESVVTRIRRRNDMAVAPEGPLPAAVVSNLPEEPTGPPSISNQWSWRAEAGFTLQLFLGPAPVKGPLDMRRRPRGVTDATR